MGLEGSGVIDQVGEGVDGFEVGDRVVTCGEHGAGKWGTFAEYAAVSIGKVAHLPRTISFAQGASVPVSARTAWQALFSSEKGDLKRDQRVLIHGGSGSVGSYAIQFAKHVGAEVAATCSAGKMDYVASLRTDVVIDYRKNNIQDAIRDWSADGADLVVDLVSCGSLPNAFDLLSSGGVLVSVFTIVGDGDVEGDMRRAAERGLRKVLASVGDENADRDMSEILALIEAGSVAPPPLQELPLDEIAQAQTLVMEGKVFVKMVLKVAELET